jgi:hypothetical protein
VALQHGWAGKVQFLFQRGDEPGMVVTDVVDTIAGIKINDPPTITSVKLGPFAALILDIHFHDVEQSRPLRVYEALVIFDSSIWFLKH